MGKKRLNITIDENVLKISKKYISNLSEQIENDLKEALRDLVFNGCIDKLRYLKCCPICNKPIDK